jgi:hypothetical protein
MKTSLYFTIFITVLLMIPLMTVCQVPDIGLSMKAGKQTYQVPASKNSLYEQLSNFADEPALACQDFNDSPAHSCQAADDFVVPAGETWMIEEIVISGQYSVGGGPAELAHLFIYLDDPEMNMPGPVFFEFVDFPVLALPEGDLVFNLIEATIEPIVLPEGHYWLSVQPHMPYEPFLQWYWIKQESPTILGEYVWRNPGGGFGLPFPDWGMASEVFPTTTDHNLAFGLYGTSTGGGSALGSMSLVIGDWLIAEEWHDWIGGMSGESKVRLFADDPGNEISEVHFYYSTDQAQTWIYFFSDTDGSQPAMSTFQPTTAEGDGWTAYFPHEMLPPEDMIVYFMAEAQLFNGEIVVVTNSIVFDPTPPNRTSINLEDWLIINEDQILLQVDPGECTDLVSIWVDVVPKVDSFAKGIPPISQQPHSETHCSPTAAAACLKYFEGTGDNTISGGLDDHDLVDSLAGRMGTNQGVEGTYISNIASGLESWVKDHGDNYTVRLMDFDWTTMRNELERCQDVIASIFWPEGGGHSMTFNSVVNTPNADGTITVDFMDPWTGEIEWGDMDPATGEVSGFTGAGEGGEMGPMVIVCPKETSSIPGDGQIYPGIYPIPDIILPIPDPGLYFLRIIFIDASNHVARTDLVVKRNPTGKLKVGDWLKSEEWHRWIGGTEGETKVEFYPDVNEGITKVDFYYSIAGTGNWILFDSDEDGQAAAAPGPLPESVVEMDGWSGYLDHSLLPDENAELEFKATIWCVESFFDVFTELSTRWDVTPPSSATTNLWDLMILTEPEILLEVYPGDANISFLDITVVPKDEYFEKGIPSAIQPGDMDCGPTALAACLKYFEENGHPNINGGYNLAELIEYLKQFCNTDPEYGTYDTDLEKGALEWINAHGGGFTVRRIGFDWQTMRNELERSQDVITLFTWKDAEGNHGGHFMTFNSVSNVPEPDGRIKVDFMDPWTGETIDGYLNPETGEVDGFTDSFGDEIVPDGAEIYSNVIICPEETSIVPDPGQTIPWPLPEPYPIPLEEPGYKWIRIEVIDEDGNKSRLDYPILAMEPFVQPHDMVLLPANKTNPEPWYRWISDVDGVSPVYLLANDPDELIANVEFYFTQDENLLNWELFYTDESGLSNGELGDVVWNENNDGWCGYLPHNLLLPDMQPIHFKAMAYTISGDVFEVVSEITFTFDQTPPNSFALNIEDGFITDQDFVSLQVTPLDGNLDYVLFQTTGKTPDNYDKNVPIISQPNDYTCGPTALAQCLKYFANHDPVKWGDVTGGLSDEELIDSLASVCRTNDSIGTTEAGMLNGINTWLENHGGGFNVSPFSPFSEFGADEMTSHLYVDGETNGVSQDIITMFENITPDGDTSYHYMTLSSVHPPIDEGNKAFDFCDPANTEKLVFDVDEEGLTSHWRFEDGYEIPQPYPYTSRIRSNMMICPTEESITPEEGEVSQGPDFPPVDTPLPDSGRTTVRVRAVDEDGNKSERDIEITRVRPAEYPPGDTAVPLNSPPFKLQGGIPAGGSYSGPHVTDGWFYPIEEGDFPIIYFFPYPNGFVTQTTFTISVFAYDFGDCPDDPYPTLLANDGARHIVDNLTFLGALIDSETDGQPNIPATGDDILNLADEDGIAFGPIVAGSAAQIMVYPNICPDSLGYLQGWMDFNNDGDWDDPGEQIFIDEALHFSSPACLLYLVPAEAHIGNVYARFRFSTVPGLSYKGAAPDGEVEDYLVGIYHDQGMKWIQEPCSELTGLHTHDLIVQGVYDYIERADDWQCNGGVVTDIHWWGDYEGQQGTGINYFRLSIYPNDPAVCLPVPMPIWSKDVPLAEVNETLTDILNSSGNYIYKYEYVLDVPFEQTEGNTYWLSITAFSNDPANVIWRWQEADRSTAPNYILCPSAERSVSNQQWNSVYWDILQPRRYSEMAFTITSETTELDFGDAPDTYKTLLASNGSRHVWDGATYLGNLIDVEPDGLPTVNADGDDLNNQPDEDGVVFRTPPVAGKSAEIKVLASVDGFLNVWLDVERNGTFADAADHVVANAGLSEGWNTLNIPVPANAAVGNSYMRFRFDTQGGCDYYGLVDNGEVEDYRVSIYPEDWGFVINPVIHTIIVPLNVVLNGVSLQANDAIGVFYTDNIGNEVCGGAIIWDGAANQVVLAYGDDVTTTPKDGFNPGEVLTWKIYHSGSGVDQYVSVNYDPMMPQSDGLFTSFGLSGLTQINGLSVVATATPDDICKGDQVQLDVIVTGGSGNYTYAWTSNPPGFTNNIKNPTDTPDQDITYYVDVNDGGIIASSSVDVSVQQPPAADAGVDATVCETDTYNLNGAATNASAVVWTTSGDGAFDDPTILTPVYTPGISDIANVTVTLTLEAYPVSPCLVSATENMTLTIQSLPIMDAGANASICPGDVYSPSATAANYSALHWVTSGTGTFSNPADINPIYTPGNADIALGYVDLCLQADPIAPCISSFIDCMTLYIFEEQSVSLFTGWNGLSSYLSPYNQNDNYQLFSPILNQLVVGYNFQGAFWPAQGNNTLVWDESSGHVTKMSSDATMVFFGDEVTNKLIQLAQGWNIIPVLSRTSVDITTIFNTSVDVKLVIEVANMNLFWPDYSINTIVNLQPGKAYYACMNTSGSIDYGGSSNKSQAAGAIEFVNSSPWNSPVATSTIHAVAFSETVCSEFEQGDIIGAFTPGNLCAGIAAFDSKTVGITIFGDDPASIANDGFNPGEHIRFKLYRPSTDEVFDLEVQYNDHLDNSGAFKHFGVSAIESINLNPADIPGLETGGISIFPNPSEGLFTIHGLEPGSRVKVFNAFGNKIYDNYPVDNILNLSGNAKGMYFITIKTLNGMHHQKIIIN